MTETGQQVMYQWGIEKKKITVHFQDGKKLTGKIIDYDDTEIVLEEGEEGNSRNPIKKVICRNWSYVQEALPASCHD